MDTKQSLSELIAQAIAASFPQAENLPSAGDVEKVVVDLDAVKGNKKPEIVRKIA